MTAPVPSPSRAPATGVATPVTRPGGSTGHIKALDGLRGLAILGVLLFHAGRFDGGFLGVDLFFVLSGFLITGLLLKEAGTQDGRIRLVAFWGRRARRLTPALAVMITGVLLLVWQFGTSPLRQQALDDAPWAVANLANWHFIAEQAAYWQSSDSQVFGHLWSISVEEQFYLVWPLLIAVLARTSKAERLVATAAATGAILSLALMVTLAEPVDTTRVYEGTDTRAFSLLLGSLMATAPASRLLDRVGARAKGWWALILAGCIAAYWLRADGQSSPGLFHGALFLHALAAALLIGCIVRAPYHPLSRFLSAPPLRGLGLVSYSLYLWHWPVFLLLGEALPGLVGWGRTAFLVAVSLAAAFVSKVLVEDPIRFRAGWAHGRTGAAALLAALVVLTALWAILPRPQLGAGSVDLTRLAAHSKPCSSQVCDLSRTDAGDVGMVSNSTEG
ncbi:acyltransferase [Streptomyces sp. PTY087I2]|uniref:acyltransferase family protein n=1 Tax=Streptomyces sp. PTY087I2 TaxID=1819298 RepID=UPI00080B3A0B|nr:acyltransferase [Streptomyces sp. PTY087I2]OCC08568.1 O-acetyltransferase OatA [Streptomyces sp. PTY087I2]